jgi:hypothetical protein
VKSFIQSVAVRRRLILALLLAGLAAGGLALLSSPKPPPFAVLPLPCKFPVTWRNRVGRWLPATATWSWVVRLDQAVFGRRKPVNLSADILTLTDSSRAAIDVLVLGPPNFSDPDGLRVWLLGADELGILRVRLGKAEGTEMLFHPRVGTTEETACRLFQGRLVPAQGLTNNVGLELGCFTRLHPESTDLFATIKFSELVTNAAGGGGRFFPAGGLAVRTNLDAALRVQIPRGKGMFLLDESPAGSDRRHLGFILDPPQP